jgi:hypothetical protein
MPTADTPVTRLHRDLSLANPRQPGFDSTYTFDTSSKVHLRSSPSYAPDSFSLPFPASLTTIALYNSRTGWFGSSIGLPEPGGLLPSLIQHGKLSFPSGHTRVLWGGLAKYQSLPDWWLVWQNVAWRRGSSAPRLPTEYMFCRPGWFGRHAVPSALRHTAFGRSSDCGIAASI